MTRLNPGGRQFEIFGARHTRGWPKMKENYISRKLIRQCQNVKESPSKY